MIALQDEYSICLSNVIQLVDEFQSWYMILSIITIGNIFYYFIDGDVYY